MKSVGERIKEQRKLIRYTQKMLADKVSVSPQVISNWERGYTEPSADDISRLSEVLPCSSDYLLGREKTAIPNKLLSKDERDIAKRMEQLAEDLTTSSDLAFYGEPISDEAKESLLEAMEFAVRTAKKINKKYTPKKYLNREKD